MKYRPREGNIIRGGRNLVESNEGGVVAAVLGVPKVVHEGFREPALGKAVMSHTQTTRCSSQVYVSRDTTTSLVHRGSCR